MTTALQRFTEGAQDVFCPLCCGPNAWACSCEPSEQRVALALVNAPASCPRDTEASFHVEIVPDEPAPPTKRSERQPAAGAVKADAGKLPLELVPTRPLEAVAAVLAFGARKYAANNWRKGLAFSRVYAAVLRHLFAWWRGEDNDPETGLSHLAHARCELDFLLEYTLRPGGPGTLDDRAGNDAG
jgi:hypothetical protein